VNASTRMFPSTLVRDSPYLILDSDPERDPRLGLAISHAEQCVISAADLEALCTRIVAMAATRTSGHASRGGRGVRGKGGRVSSRPSATDGAMEST
jgi:hypothetical protein